MVSIPLTPLTLTALLVSPTRVAASAGVMSAPAPSERSIVFQSFADTTMAAEPPFVALTEDLTKRYLSARQTVFSYIQAHQAVLPGIPVRVYKLTMAGPGGMVQGHAYVGLYDFTVLAAKVPAVAALFAKQHFPPAQFAPVTLTLRKALFAAALHQQHGWAIKPPTNVQGKNIAFVEAHASWFVGSELGTTELEP